MSVAIGEAKIIIIIVKIANITSEIVIIVEDSFQACSSLSRDRYWEKMGINANAMVPKIKTSKIASGKIDTAIKKAAERISSCFLLNIFAPFLKILIIVIELCLN